MDEDYGGNVGVILFNHSNSPFQIYRGDRIAQLMSKYCISNYKRGKKLDETERDAKGFGSTGRH